MVDTRGERPRLLAGASSSWLGPQVWRSDDLGETWQETPNGAVRFPEDTDAKVERVWQLAPGRRARRRLRRHRAGRGVPVDRRRGDVRARAGAVGPPAPPRVGRRLRRPGLPHRAAAPDRPRLGDGGHLDRRGLPDQRRREVVGAAQPRHQGGVPARGPAVPRVRPVRPQGLAAPRRGPSGCSCRTTAASTAPTTTAPPGSRSPTGCRRSSASRSSCTPTSPTRSTSSRSTAATGATRPRPRPGSGGPATPATPGRSSARDCPTRSTSRVMRDAMCADQHAEAGIYFGARNGGVWGIRRLRRDLAAAGQRPARRDGRPGRRPLGSGAWASFEVSRSETINAEPARIHALIDDFHEWTKWSPWEDVDPDLQRTYTGPDVRAPARRTPGRATARPARGA